MSAKTKSECFKRLLSHGISRPAWALGEKLTYKKQLWSAVIEA